MSAVSLAPTVDSRPNAASAAAKAEAKHLSFFYGDFQALKDLSLVVHEHRVTALIGPSFGKNSDIFLPSS